MAEARKLQIRKPLDPRPPAVEPPVVAGLVPPHDLDAEAACISAAVLSPSARDKALAILRAEHFYSDANGRIWASIAALAAAGQVPDHTAIVGWLRDREKLAAVGGAGYIVDVIDSVGASAAVLVEQNANRVRRKWRVRQLIAELQTVAAEGYGVADLEDEWIAEAGGRVSELCGEDDSVDTGASLRGALTEVFSSIGRQDGRGDEDESRPGLKTGIADLDRVLGAMRDGNMVLVGAQTGIGKSTIARQLVIQWIMKGYGGYIASVEMTREELAEAMLFTQARIDASRVGREHKLTAEEWGRLTEAASDLSSVADNVWIDDRAELTPAQIEVQVRRVKRDFERRGVAFRFVVADYIQILLPSERRRESNREQDVSSIARELKKIAKREKCVMVALSQLNSDTDKRAEKGGKPRLGDLRESKAIGQHANKVMFIHNQNAVERAEARRKGDEAFVPRSEPCEVIVAKNRKGLLGSVPLIFFPHWTYFAAEEK